MDGELLAPGGSARCGFKGPRRTSSVKNTKFLLFPKVRGSKRPCCDFGHALIVTCDGCLAGLAKVESRYALADYLHREVLFMKALHQRRPGRAFLSFITSAFTILSAVSTGLSPAFAQVLIPPAAAGVPDDG